MQKVDRPEWVDKRPWVGINMRLLSHNEGAVHGHQHKGRRACDAVAAGIAAAHLKPEEFLFPSRVSDSPHLSTRQYSRIVGAWVGSIGLDPAAYATHTMRRTKATLIYRRTRNLRAVQLLLGRTKFESTVRYLGIEVDDALEIAEQTEV